MANNKLFCTFCTLDNVDDVLEEVINSYSILYEKIFIFTTSKPQEYILTYNVDIKNNRPELIRNTIMVHRKKESNSLYTINALNKLIELLNNGILDMNYKINWLDYSNCLLLSQNNELKTTYLKLDEIIYLN